jgi:hypothetical protein
MKTLRAILPYLFIPIVIAALYDGWVFYSRWNDNQQIKHKQEQQEAEAAKRVADLVGGDAVKILNFAASKGTLHHGEHTTLCYGVNEAARVRIEPELPNVYPAFSNCLDIAPTKTTTYKLIAEDKAGKAVDASLTINVR